MNNKQKIYVETTLFNFFIDEDKGDTHIDTFKLFKEIAADKFDVYTS